MGKRNKKDWKDFTEEEIIAIQQERCFKCEYARLYGNIKANRRLTNENFKMVTCDYYLLTGERRNCRVDECEKWRKENENNN